jgi:hypothetical protein
MLLDQLKRVERLRRVRRYEQQRAGAILFRGEPTPLRIVSTAQDGWTCETAVIPAAVQP